MSGINAGITEAIGKRIRERREYQGRSQAELGRALGKGVPAISLIESGRNNITAAEIVRVAEFLKCTVGYFCGEGEPSPDDEVLVYYKALPPDQRDTVLTMLKALARGQGI